MTHPNDPWANTDHDPSSGTESHTDTAAIHTTPHTLALARADIHTAVGAHDDPHRGANSTHGRHCPTPTQCCWPPTPPMSSAATPATTRRTRWR